MVDFLLIWGILHFVFCIFKVNETIFCETWKRKCLWNLKKKAARKLWALLWASVISLSWPDLCNSPHCLIIICRDGSRSPKEGIWETLCVMSCCKHCVGEIKRLEFQFSKKFVIAFQSHPGVPIYSLLVCDLPRLNLMSCTREKWQVVHL